MRATTILLGQFCDRDTLDLTYTLSDPLIADAALLVLSGRQGAVTLDDYLADGRHALPDFGATDPDEPPRDILTRATARLSVNGYQDLLAGVPVNASEVFDDLTKFLASYVDYAPSALDIAALYVVMSHLYTLFFSIPYLHILGPPGTGKSRLGAVLNEVLFAPVFSAGASDAAIARLLAFTAGSLILDEQGGELRKRRELLRAGYRRDGCMHMCSGFGRAVHPIRCFGPKVFLTNEPLGDAPLASRTLRIESRLGSPRRCFLPEQAASEATSLRDRLHRFALHHAADIRAEYERIAGAGKGRPDEIKSPLRAIAAVLDGLDPSLGLSTRCRDAFDEAIQGRERATRLMSDDPVLVRLVLNFAGTAPLNTAHRADEFTEHVNSTNALGRPYRTKELAEKLNRLSLISARRMLDVGHVAGPIGSAGTSRKRVQRVHYQFDIQRANDLAADMGA